MICLFLIWYLEQVLGGAGASSGVKQHPLFCLKKRFWANLCGKDESHSNLEEAGSGSPVSLSQVHPEGEDLAAVKLQVADCTKPLLAADALPSDVLEEHNRVLDAETETMARMVAMRKVYPGVGGAAPKTAVRMVSLGLEKEMCFGEIPVP